MNPAHKFSKLANRERRLARRSIQTLQQNLLQQVFKKSEEAYAQSLSHQSNNATRVHPTLVESALATVSSS